MIGSRGLSLGSTSPVISEDLCSVFVNPASIADVETLSFAVNNRSVLSDFHYNSFTLAFPFYLQDIAFLKDKKRRPDQLFAFALSYGSLRLNDISKTTLDSTGTFDPLFDRIREIDRFNAGFNVFSLSAASSIYQFLELDQISFGLNAKVIQYFVDQQSEYGLGIDAGASISRYFYHSLINKVQFGLSIQNLLSSGFEFKDSLVTTTLPINFLFGVKGSFFEEALHLYLHNNLDTFSFGIEYAYTDSLQLRGSSNFKTFNLGLGLIIAKLPALTAPKSYNVRIDYNYSQNQYPYNSEPSHAVSLTFFGSSKPANPYILIPEKNLVLTKKSKIKFSGFGPKKSLIYAYNNEGLSRSTYSNAFGNWSFKRFPLKPGKNVLHVQSKDKDLLTSYSSQSIHVFYDNKTPTFKTVIYPKDQKLFFKINAAEQLSSIHAVYDKKSLVFEKSSFPTKDPFKPSVHFASIPLPNHLLTFSRASKKQDSFSIYVKDRALNQSPTFKVPFFMSLSFPQDQYVHYKKSLRIIGKSSSQVKKIIINSNPVYIDKNNNFSIPIQLNVGKNLIPVQCKTYGDDLTYSMRILRLQTFDDIDSSVKGRREIEFLATLGLLPSDDKLFLPEQEVTRGYLTKLIVLSEPNVTLKPVNASVSFDVSQNHPDAPYIQAAIKNGLMRVFPDGTFRPDTPLTLAQIIDLLFKSGFITYQDATADNTKNVKRRELAEFLAYLPQYQIKINQLTNWDVGY